MFRLPYRFIDLVLVQSPTAHHFIVHYFSCSFATTRDQLKRNFDNASPAAIIFSRMGSCTDARTSSFIRKRDITFCTQAGVSLFQRFQLLASAQVIIVIVWIDIDWPIDATLMRSLDNIDRYWLVHWFCSLTVKSAPSSSCLCSCSKFKWRRILAEFFGDEICVDGRVGQTDSQTVVSIDLNRPIDAVFLCKACPTVNTFECFSLQMVISGQKSILLMDIDWIVDFAAIPSSCHRFAIHYLLLSHHRKSAERRFWQALLQQSLFLREQTHAQIHRRTHLKHSTTIKYMLYNSTCGWHLAIAWSQAMTLLIGIDSSIDAALIREACPDNIDRYWSVHRFWLLIVKQAPPSSCVCNCPNVQANFNEIIRL